MVERLSSLITETEGDLRNSHLVLRAVFRPILLFGDLSIPLAFLIKDASKHFICNKKFFFKL